MLLLELLAEAAAEAGTIFDDERRAMAARPVFAAAAGALMTTIIFVATLLICEWRQQLPKQWPWPLRWLWRLDVRLHVLHVPPALYKNAATVAAVGRTLWPRTPSSLLTYKGSQLP